MYAIYLDDSSGKKGITCLAGYLSLKTQWEHFERDASEIYAKHGINCMRGTDLHESKNDFKKWHGQGAKKRAFVEEVFSAAAASGLCCGWATCVDHEWHARQQQAYPDKASNVSTLGFALSTIILSLSRLRTISYGISLIIERGNKNNANLEQYIEAVRDIPDLPFANSDIDFVDKGSCKAIHLADMLAFFSRRAVERPATSSDNLDRSDPILGIIDRHTVSNVSLFDGRESKTRSVGFFPLGGFPRVKSSNI